MIMAPACRHIFHNIHVLFISSPMTRMWHTACCTSLPGEVVIFGGCTSSVLDDDPVMSVNFTSSRDHIPYEYLWCQTLELSNTS